MLSAHTWSIVPGTIDVEMITTQLVEMIEDVEEAAFTRGVAAGQEDGR